MQPNASVAVIVNDELPAAVGVPKIVPNRVRLMPPGRMPALTVYWYGLVPPTAATSWL